MQTSRARQERPIWSIGSSLATLGLPPKDPDDDDNENEEDDGLATSDDVARGLPSRQMTDDTRPG